MLSNALHLTQLDPRRTELAQRSSQSLTGTQRRQSGVGHAGEDPPGNPGLDSLGCVIGEPSETGRTDIAGEHLIERFRLFFLIVLGESVLTAGNAFTEEPFDVERLLALAIGFTGTVALGNRPLWWCYFHRTQAIGIELAENAADAGGVGWWATWTLMLMVLALIAHRRRRRARHHPSGRRSDAWLHDPHFRWTGAVPARPGLLPAQCAG
jgi:MYXO-CTERM domain-containing protein